MNYRHKGLALIFRFLAHFGYRVSRIVDLEQVHELLSILKPKKSELIRIGGDGDGAYLVPNDLTGIESCFSPGVALHSNFENELSQLGIKSFLADYSVSNPSVENKSFNFIKKYIAPYDSNKCIDFENWITTNSHPDSELILQMDIEGAEYSNLLHCRRDVLKRFRIMVVEFHYLDLILDAGSFQIIRDVFFKLTQDFEVVHMHPNSGSRISRVGNISVPSMIEMTFIRKDRSLDLGYSTCYPHPLDVNNTLDSRGVVLPKCWYSHD